MSEAFEMYSELKKQLEEIRAFVTIQAVTSSLSGIEIADLAEEEIIIEKEMDRLWRKEMSEEDRKLFDLSKDKE